MQFISLKSKQHLSFNEKRNGGGRGGGDGSVERVRVTCNALWLCNSLKPIKQAPSRVLKRRVVCRCWSSLLNLPCELHDDRQDTHTRVGEYPYKSANLKEQCDLLVLKFSFYCEHSIASTTLITTDGVKLSALCDVSELFDGVAELLFDDGDMSMQSFMPPQTPQRSM